MAKKANHQQNLLRVMQDLLSVKCCLKQKFAKCCKKRQEKNFPEQQLAIFTNSYPEQQFATFEEEKTIQRGKLRKFGQNNKLSETTMCKHVVWNDNLQKVIRNNNDVVGQFGNFAKKKKVKEKEENIARRKISFW